MSPQPFALALVLVSAAAAAKEKVAVVPLQPGQGLPSDSPLGAKMAKYVIEAIQAQPGVAARYDVLPAEDVQIKFFAYACYEPTAPEPLPKCLAKFGQQAGADHVLFGMLSLDGVRYQVALRAVSWQGELVQVTNLGAEATVSVANDWSDALDLLGAPVGRVLRVESAPPQAKEAAPAVAVAAPAAQEAGPGLRYAAWGTAAGAVIALGAGTWFALSARGLDDDLAERFAKQGRYYPEDRADIESADSGYTRANVLFGVGSALAVTSGIFFYVSAGEAMLAVQGGF